MNLSLHNNSSDLVASRAHSAARYALHHNQDYVDELLQKYEERCNLRRSAGIPALMICGQGGAGKDFAAKHLCNATKMKYSGSTSSLVAPLVAFAADQDVKTAFEERRQNRQFWYEFCNEVRRHDPTLLAKLNLAEGDLVVGPRDDFEVYEIMKQVLVDVSIWIENPRAKQDTTVKFGAQDCDLVVMNDGGRFDLCRKLDKLVQVLKTEYLPHVKT